MAFRRPLGQVRQDDIQKIVGTHRPEDLTTEYEEALPVDWGGRRRDTAALADTSGGDLFPGIRCGGAWKC